MILTLIAILAATDPRAALAGTWRGESICTPVRSACHDEIAVYHITVLEKPGVVDIIMNKIVDGKEVEMGGTVEYTVNADATSLTSEYVFKSNHLKWSFTRSGDDMRGTLIDVPTGDVIRNIRIKKAEGRK